MHCSRRLAVRLLHLQEDHYSHDAWQQGWHNGTGSWDWSIGDVCNLKCHRGQGKGSATIILIKPYLEANKYDAGQIRSYSYFCATTNAAR